jgi:transcription-repair coupling factor (superfamily II helicase)
MEHIEEVEDMKRELKDRFGPLPPPVDNLLYIMKIKVLAARADVNSIYKQGKRIVIKPNETVIASVAKQSLGKGYDAAIKIGATQVKLDTRVLGDRWIEVLEEILRAS